MYTYCLPLQKTTELRPLHVPVNVSQDTAMWDNDKTPILVLVSAYLETAQLDNTKIHGHVAVSAHQ